VALRTVNRSQSISDEMPKQCAPLTARTWALLPSDERSAICVASDESAVLAVAKKYRDQAGVAMLRNVGRVTWLEETLNAASTSALYKNALIVAMVDEAVTALISASATVADCHVDESLMEIVSRLASDEFSIPAIRVAMAVILDYRLKNRQQIRELGASDSTFKLPLNDGATFDLIDKRQASREVQLLRSMRRVKRRRERLQRVQQQERAKQCSTKKFLQPTSGSTSVFEKPSEGGEADHQSVELRPRVHPRLPAAADGTTDRAGEIAIAMIRWGSHADEGKRRPVIVVGESETHFWVRPMYTNDICAGGWRALSLPASPGAPVHHDGFVDVRIRRVVRTGVRLTGSKLDPLQWNRLCRGEVR